MRIRQIAYILLFLSACTGDFKEKLNEVSLSKEAEIYLTTICEDNGFDEFRVHLSQYQDNPVMLNIDLISSSELSSDIQKNRPLAQEIARRILGEVDIKQQQEINTIFISVIQDSNRVLLNHSSAKSIQFYAYNGKIIPRQ